MLSNVVQILIYLQAEKNFHGQEVYRFYDIQKSVTSFKKIY